MLERILDFLKNKYFIGGTALVALILVGRVFGEQTFRDSALYHPDHVHVLRPKTKKVSVG